MFFSAFSLVKKVFEVDVCWHFFGENLSYAKVAPAKGAWVDGFCQIIQEIHSNNHGILQKINTPLYLYRNLIYCNINNINAHVSGYIYIYIPVYVYV